MPGPVRRLQFVGVEPDGEGAVVDEGDLHHRAKDATADVLGSEVRLRQLAKALVEGIGLRGRGRVGERRPAAAASVGVKRELAHDERLACHIS